MLVSLLVVAVLVHNSAQSCLTDKDNPEDDYMNYSAHSSLKHSALQFSVDLLKAVTSLQPGENVLFSPYSVFQALLLTYFISAGHTESSLRTALHLNDTYDKNGYLSAYTLDEFYNKKHSTKKGACQMNSANQLAYSKNVKVKPCMRTILSNYLQSVHFEKDVDSARRRLNEWVQEHTLDEIKDFIPKHSLSENSQLVLLNAVYFKCGWKTEFDVKETYESEFYLSDGSKATCQMMKQEGKFKLRIDEQLDAEVLELPYRNNDTSMFVILPARNEPHTIHDLVKNIYKTKLQNLIKTKINGTEQSIVTLPKFNMKETLPLTQILKHLGLGEVFEETADFSSLTGTKDVTFTEATHMAKIQVDEKGSTAAAATALFTARMASPTFTADHPFVYFIYDKKTEQVLFFGVFNSPPTI